MHHYRSVSHPPLRTKAKECQELFGSGKPGGLGLHWIHGQCQEKSALRIQAVIFLFLYAEHKYLEAASSSFWSHHTTTLTGLSAQCSLQCISHTQCKSSRAICQCGDGQGGEEMPLWCVYLMCLFKCALSPQMLVEWPRCHQAWAPCFCVGSRSVFFLPHVPISNLIKENIEIKLFPPSFLTS